MEDILNKMEQLSQSLMSKIEETESSLIDQLKVLNEKIDSKDDQVPDFVDPFISYEKIERIGEGAYGVVYLVRDRRTNEVYAMKTVVLEGNNIPSDIAREISLLYDVDHVNIIKLKEVLPYKKKLHMVMEAAGVELYDFLKSEVKKGKKVAIKVIKDWLRQLLSAVSYLHQIGIMHRDLKTENILVGGSDDVRSRLKICDFGSARRYGDVPVLTPRPSTLVFMAPEMLAGDTYGRMADIWAIGCIFFEMMENRNPFDQRGQQRNCSDLLMDIFSKIGVPKEGSKLCSVRDHLKDKGYLETSDIVPSLLPVPGLDADGNNLLKRLLALDPLDRITAQEALSHPFLEVSSAIETEDKVVDTLETAEMVTAKRKRSKFDIKPVD